MARGGTIWNLGSAALPLVGSFAVSILLAPWLGDAGWGHYSTVVSAATLLLIVGKLGVHAATSRLLTENLEEDPGRWLRAGLGLRLVATGIVALLALLASGWLAERFGGGELQAPMRWLPAVILGASLFEFSGESLVGMRRFGGQFLQRAAFLLLRLGAVVWVRLLALSSARFLAAHALALLVPSIIFLGWAMRSLPRGTAPLAPAVRETLRLSLPLALGSASFLIYAHTDRLMLAWFEGPATVGQFSIARNVLDAALFPTTALAWGMRPLLVKALRAGHRKLARRELAHGMGWSLLIALAVPALLWPLGEALIVAIYGEGFREAGQLFVLMLPILALRAIGTPVFPALLGGDDQAYYARLMVWTAAINVAGNLLLIPRFGAMGAVGATVIALLPLSIAGLLRTRKLCGGLPAYFHPLSPLLLLLMALPLTFGLQSASPDQRGLVWLLLAAALGGLALLAPQLWLARRAARSNSRSAKDLP